MGLPEGEARYRCVFPGRMLFILSSPARNFFPPLVLQEHIKVPVRQLPSPLPCGKEALSPPKSRPRFVSADPRLEVTSGREVFPLFFRLFFALEIFPS